MKTYTTIALFFTLAASPGLHAASYDCRLDYSRSLVLSTPVSGQVKEVKVAVGDHVQKGQLLVSLDSRPFQAKVQQSRARVVAAREQQEEAQREMQRAEELFDRTVLSIHEKKLVEIELTKAKAALQSAQAEQQLAQVDLEYSQVRAPFAGKIVALDAQPGQTVISRLQATPLVTLAQARPMAAQCQVPVDQLQSLEPGVNAKVRVGGESYNGKIARIESIDSGNGSGSGTARMRVVAEFEPDASHRLWVGQSAQVEWP